MRIIERAKREAFALWLRTGRWPVGRGADDLEHKFNPYHDPRNGQFTFTPGGSDFQPSYVLIIRPRQIGSGHT